MTRFGPIVVSRSTLDIIAAAGRHEPTTDPDTGEVSLTINGQRWVARADEKVSEQ